MSSETERVYDELDNLENQRTWKPGLECGVVKAVWIDGYDQLFVREVDDGYRVRYREGRFGAYDELPYNDFERLDFAEQYAELIVEGHADVDELLGT